jgi:acetylornithine/N-succinyldiaminopimelate aminotransferase
VSGRSEAHPDRVTGPPVWQTPSSEPDGDGVREPGSRGPQWNEPAVAGTGTSPFIPVFPAPLATFVRGRGTELWDIDGKRYLDFLSGIAVVSLGHADPVVAAAIAEQASTLVHVSNYFANPVTVGAAGKLVDLLAECTGADGQVFFCNSGAEANEAALKLARKFGGRGRHVVVSAFGSFHGRTLAALAATGQPTKHEPFHPMPDGFRHVAYNDLAALEAVLDPSVSAVLLEPLQGEGGVIPADDEYLRGVRRLCDERGMLLILDEVQTGFGRTGRWFGFEHAGVLPDAVTMAKAMGNGFPVGALWARREVAAVFQPGDHGSTFSGSALAGAVVSTVIDELRRLDAPALAERRGAELSSALVALDGVAGVRGRGLLLGVELAVDRPASEVADELLRRGLVVNAVTAGALRLAPPLTVSSEEIAEAVALIAECTG